VYTTGDSVAIVGPTND